jgi:hypothetical protein
MILRSIPLVVALLALASPARAASYEFSNGITGYHCEEAVTKAVGGTVDQWECSSVVLMIDRDTGYLYSCGAIFGDRLLNGNLLNHFINPNATCQSVLKGNLNASVTSWQMLPAYDPVGPLQPNPQATVKPHYFWHSSGAQIEVCLQVPYGQNLYPSTALFGETICVESGPFATTPAAITDQVLVPPPPIPNNP